MPNAGLDDALKALERLTSMFRMERLIYLSVTLSSLVLLLIAVGMMIVSHQAGKTELTLMFGSSGLVTFSTARLLHMWNQAFQLISDLANSERKTKKPKTPDAL